MAQAARGQERGRGWSLGRRIAAIVLLTALPLLAATLTTIGRLTDAAREAQLAGLRYSARAIAVGLDAQLGKYLTLAEILSASPNLLNDDLTQFAVEARRTFSQIPDVWIVVADLDGRQLLNTFTDAPASLPMRHPVALAGQKRAFEARGPRLAGVRLDPVGLTFVATVETPVFKDGAPFRALAVTMTMKPFARLLAAQQMPEGWLAGILDEAGLYVARVPGGEYLVGQQAAPGWRETAGREGRFEFDSRDGVALINENAVTTLGGWTVGVGVSKQALDAAAFDSIRWSTLAALALMGATLGLAGLLARAVMRPLSELTAFVRDPSAPVPAPTDQPEVEALRRALVQARVDEDAHERRQALLLEATSRLLALKDREKIGEIVSAALAPELGVDLYIKYRLLPKEGVFALTHEKGLSDALRAKALRLTPDAPASRARDALIAAPAAGLLNQAGARASSCHDLHAMDGEVLGALCFASTRRGAFSGEEELFFATLANIASQAIERTEADAALRQAHDTFRQLVDGSPFGIYTVDADFRLAGVSLGAQKIFQSVEARIGEDFGVVMRRIWPEPFATEAIGHFRRTLETGAPYHALRTVEQRRDGRAQEAYDWKIERVITPDGRPGVVCHFYDLSERVRYEAELNAAHERQAVLMRELAHRGKNLIAVIQAIASRSFIANRPTAESRAIFSGRLQALANTFATFNESSAEMSPLREIVATELEVYTAKVALEGPRILLPAAAAQTFALIVHELATNAAKYGALSCEEGHVDAIWRIRREESGARFEFLWRETGGPPATAPTRRSFGTTLITQIAGGQFGCAPEVAFEATGLRYSFDAPLERVGEPGEA